MAAISIKATISQTYLFHGNKFHFRINKIIYWSLWIGSWISIMISHDHQEIFKWMLEKIKKKKKKTGRKGSTPLNHLILGFVMHRVVQVWMHAKRLQSCLTLCDPMDCIPPGFFVSMGFFWQGYWGGLTCPSPGIFLPQGSNPPLSHIWSKFFTTNAT